MEPSQPSSEPNTNQPVVPPEPAAPESQSPPVQVAAVSPQVTPTQPIQPDGQGMVVGTDQAAPVTSVSPTGSGASGGNKKKWLLPAVVVAVLVVLLGGGYVFGLYLPNRPASVYSSSLKNSGKAVDKLVDYSTSLSKQDYKSYALDGTLNIKSSGASVDGTIKGSFDLDGNETGNIAIDALGQKVNAEIRSVHAKGNDAPDIYVKVSGIKQALASYGLGSLSSLDGQWLSIDHTLIDTYTRSFTQELQSMSGTSTEHVNLGASTPTSAQITDAAKKIQVVNKQYLFTTDSGKAVLANQKYIGKETQDGRTMYHYTVGYNKDHLVAYVGALKTALDSSSLNDWSQAQYKEDLSKQVDFDSAITHLKQLDGKGTFDLYADPKTKLVHSVRFKDSTDSNTTFTVAQNYTGGDEYPFDLSFSDTTSGAASKGDVNFTINQKTNQASVALTTNQSSTDISVKIKITPSNSPVNATVPAGAQSVTTILSQLGLTGGL